MNTPNIIGGERVAWAAAIVCGCIVAYVVAMILIGYFSPSCPASAGVLVGAGFLLKG